MWRNGLGVHRACQADRVDAARSLANDCLREQPRIGREKTLHKVLIAGAWRERATERVGHGARRV